VLGPKRRALLSLALALVALGASADLVLLTARGAGAPSWAHWWCSASALRQHGGQSSGGITATLLGSLRAIAPHWPHILPIVVALATLVYLRRANARYHANEPRTELHV
jgi:integral membrane sensor domain MASE1